MDGLKAQLEELWPVAMGVGLNVLWALLALVVTWVAAKLVSRAVNRLTERGIDETLVPVLETLAVWGTYVVGGMVVLDIFGANTTSLVALLGAAGLAIGLALKDTLQCIAAGFVLLGLRPFRVGETIQFGSIIGTVRKVGLFTTELDTPDGLRISAPNDKVWGETLTNFTRNASRRIEIIASIAYGDDIETGMRVLRQLVAQEPRILQEPEPAYAVRALADSSVNLHLRAWAKTDEYWDVYWDLMKKLKPALEAEGLTIPFPQRELHIVNGAEKSMAKAEVLEQQ
ncbi:mechanosensitive ion channel family protein [Microbulbifer hydrolyticus]|uniref:Small-conductance mechanosensitive channel n=1 Tax=Microbulbifer hydrolyticus TaxID=48074 RepID=A0A6P1T429_9GAMM|nr:mechanosensitive ion channel family protein [Microbulbifer hydrolyticus]MBB5211599.1 small conductance mechanosensitive channel [Microbulbifer hydrolyticus]QHQ37664.1 mechanosensitive ion channel [Microbulbifer hydrolyticus]